MSNHATKEHGPQMIASAVPTMATAGPMRAVITAIMRASIEGRALRTVMATSRAIAAMMGIRVNTRPAGVLAGLMAMKPSTATADMMSARIDTGAGESKPKMDIAAG